MLPNLSVLGSLRLSLPAFLRGLSHCKAGGFACQGALIQPLFPFALPGLPSLGTLSIAVKGCSESSGLGTLTPLGSRAHWELSHSEGVGKGLGAR